MSVYTLWIPQEEVRFLFISTIYKAVWLWASYNPLYALSGGYTNACEIS